MDASRRLGPLRLVPVNGQPITMEITGGLLTLRLGDDAWAELPHAGRDLAAGLRVLAAGTNELTTLCEMFWNRMANAFASLTTHLADHSMTFESTPVARFPATAQRYYGEWNAHRSSLATVISLVIGTGKLEDFQRAQQLIEQWTQRRLLSSSVAEIVRDHAVARITESSAPTHHSPHLA